MVLKLFNMLGLASLATLIAVGGFIGYLVVAGRLGGLQFAQIGGILRGEIVAVGPGSPAATTQPVSTQPAATQPATLQPGVQTRSRQYVESLMLDRARRDMQAQKSLLDQALGQVVREQESLEQSRSQFDQTKTASKRAALDAGFQRERELFINMPPEQAKNHVVNSWPDRKADMVRLFMSIDTTTARKILSKFETDSEKKVASELLTEIRLQGGEGAEALIQGKGSARDKKGATP
jgi:hypothetical protein